MSRLKKLTAAAIVFVILAICPQTVVFAEAEEEGYVKLMEMNDESIDMIIEDLIDLMALKAEHPELFSMDQEMIDRCNSAKSIFQKQYTDKYMVTVDTQKLIKQMLTEEGEISTLSEEELLEFIGPHAGTIIVQQVLAAKDVASVAFSSIMSASKSYVADLDQEILLLLEYDDEFSIAVNIGTSGDHVITAIAKIIPTDTVPQIHYLLI